MPLEKHPGQAPPVNEDRPKRQTLLEWTTDVCRVSETTKPYPIGREIFTGCVDGLVVAERHGTRSVYACPLCDRAQAIMTDKIKRWPGPYTLRTDEEMRKIYEDRQERADGIRRGAASTPQLETEKIGA